MDFTVIFVFNAQDIKIGDIVSSRLSAIRKLQSNPNDVQALNNMYKINKKVCAK